MTVLLRPLRTAGGQAAEDGGFPMFEIRQFQGSPGSELTVLVSHCEAGRVQSALVRFTGPNLT